MRAFRARAAAPCRHPASSWETLFPARDYITGEAFTVVRCRECGLVRTLPRPSAEEIGRYYPSGYYGEAKRYPGSLQAALNQLYARRAAELETVAGVQRGKALDIGCGQGYLLDALRRRGWTVIGTELSEQSARHARETLGLDVRVGDIESVDIPTQSFDLIVMWHVLEHVSDPFAQLCAVSGLLKPGGLLLVAVPNFGSPEARWGRDRWFHLDVPRHLNHFDLPTLESALGSSSLTVERVSYFAPEYDFFSAVQTSLNLLGIRQNLLYNLIRSRDAKLLSTNGENLHTRGELVATAILAPVLGAMSLLWVPLAARLGAGSTMSVYARKA